MINNNTECQMPQIFWVENYHPTQKSFFSINFLLLLLLLSSLLLRSAPANIGRRCVVDLCGATLAYFFFCYTQPTTYQDNSDSFFVCEKPSHVGRGKRRQWCV